MRSCHFGVLNMSEYLCKFCSASSFQTVYDRIKDWEYGVEGDYSYVRCSDCSGVQLHPFPTLDLLKNAYHIDYHGYIASTAKGFFFAFLYAIKEFLLKKKLKKLQLHNAKVLDIGCGCGEFLSRLKEIGASETVGIDFNEHAVEEAKKRGHRVYKGLFQDFESPGNYFDLIVLNNYLEHTTDPKGEIAKAYALLKPGGTLMGEVPGFDSVERRIFGRFWGGNHVPRHTFQFDTGFLKKLLEEHSFRSVSMDADLNTGHLALSVQNLMQRNKDLYRNHLQRGRTWYYTPLLLFFIPFNIFMVWMKKAGVLKFFAKK